MIFLAPKCSCWAIQNYVHEILTHENVCVKFTFHFHAWNFHIQG